MADEQGQAADENALRFLDWAGAGEVGGRGHGYLRISGGKAAR